MLREGVTFAVGEAEQRGIRVRLVGQDLEVELTDETVARLLLTHLQPRFRALVEGIVR
jgi:V/A-type H+-transporting ATPase subunit E